MPDNLGTDQCNGGAKKSITKFESTELMLCVLLYLNFCEFPGDLIKLSKYTKSQ